MSQSGAADVLAGSAAVLFCESMMQVRHCLSLSFHLLSLPFTAFSPHFTAFHRGSAAESMQGRFLDSR